MKVVSLLLVMLSTLVLTQTTLSQGFSELEFKGLVIHNSVYTSNFSLKSGELSNCAVYPQWHDRTDCDLLAGTASIDGKAISLSKLRIMKSVASDEGTHYIFLGQILYGDSDSGSTFPIVIGYLQYNDGSRRAYLRISDLSINEQIVVTK